MATKTRFGIAVNHRDGQGMTQLPPPFVSQDMDDTTGHWLKRKVVAGMSGGIPLIEYLAYFGINYGTFINLRYLLIINDGPGAITLAFKTLANRGIDVIVTIPPGELYASGDMDITHDVKVAACVFNGSGGSFTLTEDTEIRVFVIGDNEPPPA